MLQSVVTGFRSYTESSIFAQTAAVIDVDAFSDIDWGLDSGTPMVVSPLRKIKQEKVSDADDIEEIVDIPDAGSKKKGKARAGEDHSRDLEFDARFHKMSSVTVRAFGLLFEHA
jgi:hypothetical protein